MLCIAIFTGIALVAVAAELVQMEPAVKIFSSKSWIKGKILNDDEMIRAVFVLKHDTAAIQSFEKNLIEVSTPTNPRYGSWLKVNA